VPEPERFAAYPETIRHGMAHRDLVYTRVPGWYAVCLAADEEMSTTLRDRAGRPVLVLEGAPPDGVSAVPVYALGCGGPPAVPTEVVFVRFASGTDAVARRAELAKAGYEIVEVPVYAPNAAWVCAASGEPADALARLDRIETLPDVENVEPNFLVEAQRRDEA
jgi:hypothetical protein